MKAFTIRFVHDESNLANSPIKVLNIATVDAPGMIFLSPLLAQAKPVESSCHSYNRRRTLSSFHTTAARGDDVSYRRGLLRCLFNFEGNARASTRGTDNRRFHAFFVSIPEDHLMIESRKAFCLISKFYSL